MTAVVFACKSNSCRSQMAEGWAKEWIKSERIRLESRRIQRHQSSLHKRTQEGKVAWLSDHDTVEFNNPKPPFETPSPEHQSRLILSNNPSFNQHDKDELRDCRIGAFLDGLTVVSVALDESFICSQTNTFLKTRSQVGERKGDKCHGSRWR